MFGNGTLICIGFNRAQVFVFSPEMTPQARMVPDVNTNPTVSVYFTTSGAATDGQYGFCVGSADALLFLY